MTIKRIVLACMLALCVTDCLAGYSSGGGRSGFSSGSSRGYSNTRAYVTPRSYTSNYRSAPRTVIHNNHYGSSGYGHGGHGGFGGGFLSGMLGGYIGGSLANHNTTVVAPTGMAQGQGMLTDSPVVYASGGVIALDWLVILFFICVIPALIWSWCNRPRSCNHNKW